MDVLPIPPDAEKANDARESIRGWVVDGQHQIILAAWSWKEHPGLWGRMLADTVSHLARAIAIETGRDRDTAYRALHS